MIYIKTDEEEPTIGMTPAILGRAVLGKTILGKAYSLPKLNAPVIRIVSLEDGEEEKRLSTPVIYLEVIENGEQEPSEPEITKLETPVIYLELVNDEIPDEPEEPDEPVTVKLATPAIYIEVIKEEEPEEPGEPDEPEEPTLILEDGVLYWSEVEGVQAYAVLINGSTILATTYDNFIDVKEMLSGYSPGEYVLTVSAIRADGFVNIGGEVIYHHVVKLGTPEIEIVEIEVINPYEVLKLQDVSGFEPIYGEEELPSMVDLQARIPIEPGQIVRVLWDGQEYICQCDGQYEHGGTVVTGNYTGDYFEGLNQWVTNGVAPFLIVTFSDSQGNVTIRIYTRVSGYSHRVGVYLDDGTIRKCAIPTIWMEEK